MEGMRSRTGGLLRVLTRLSGHQPRPAHARRGPQSDGVPVLDVVYIVGILALIALVALIAKGVEKL